MNQHIPQEPPGAQTTESTKSGVKQSVEQAKEKIKTQASQITSQARQKGQEYVEGAKSRTAETIHGVSENLRQTSDRIEHEQDPNIAHYTRLVAEKLEQAASYVRETDIRDLKADAEDLARRHPAVFFGGMFLAGIAAARFLKASTETREDEHLEGEEDYATGDYESAETAAVAPETTPEYPSHPVPTL